MNVHITPFKPCWWLKNAHTQTIAATWFKAQKLEGIADRVELADGDFIDLIWYGQTRVNQPLVLILHGLEGSDDSHYVRSAVRALEQAGFRVVFMFHRGCSAEHNRLARSYHSGETGDMAEVMMHIEIRTGEAIYAAVGYSLGANALLKYLGEQGASARVERAIAVSTPFDLHAACIKLDSGLSRVYQRHLVDRLIRRFEGKFKNRPSPISVKASTLKSFLKFDEHVTAALNGFDGALDYYTRSSSRQYLSGIRKPCLIIHAADDPFLPDTCIPSTVELPACVKLQLSQNGGHVGFIEGRLKPRRWLDGAILRFLENQ
jgi:predicted alpha/beta-fold hydrolase